MARKKKRRGTGLWLIAIIVMLICGAVSYKRINLNVKYKDLKEQERILTQDLKDAKDCTKALNEQKEYAKTKEYIEEVARDKLGLVKKGELILEAEE